MKSASFEGMVLKGRYRRRARTASPHQASRHIITPSYHRCTALLNRLPPVPAGRVHQWVRVASGRTGMIVFPLRRSVGLKAATASSRVETVPMFIRSRPSRTRWTISLSWARSDSTTKPTPRPPGGPAPAPRAVGRSPRLGQIGLDDEGARQAAGGPRLGRPDDGHQCSSGSNQAYGPPPDVSADDIEHQIDSPDVFQGVVLKVDELLRAEVERLLTVGITTGADDIRAGLARELSHHRPDCAGRAVHEDALPRL